MNFPLHLLLGWLRYLLQYALCYPGSNGKVHPTGQRGYSMGSDTRTRQECVPQDTPPVWSEGQVEEHEEKSRLLTLTISRLMLPSYHVSLTLSSPLSILLTSCKCFVLSSRTSRIYKVQSDVICSSFQSLGNYKGVWFLCCEGRRGMSRTCIIFPTSPLYIFIRRFRMSTVRDRIFPVGCSYNMRL